MSDQRPPIPILPPYLLRKRATGRRSAIRVATDAQKGGQKARFAWGRKRRGLGEAAEEPAVPISGESVVEAP